ncbi:hypothetical protein WDZ92_20320 [Nostoc sp. NIES-2111]
MSDNASPARGGRPLKLTGRTAKRYATQKLNERRRAFVEHIVWDGLSADAAAERVGVSINSARQWLRYPVVMELMANERKALIGGERPRNVHALVDVRENSKNAMARVAAARELESMAADAGFSKSAQGERPGYVIAISDSLMQRLQASGTVPQIPPSMAPAQPVIEGQAEEIEG